MRIAEIYGAPQGEGELTGTPSVFVRTTGCNLRCWFCDTPFTSWQPEGEHVPLDELVARIAAFATEHVVITGGEPLLPGEIVELTRRLKALRHFITIETAGTVYRDVVADLMSISPKLSNSTPSPDRSATWSSRHDALRERPEVIAKLMANYQYQLKFVVDQPADIDEIDEFLSRQPTLDRARVWLMPQAITREDLVEKSEWLEPLATEHGLMFSSRRHIELHGNMRGK